MPVKESLLNLKCKVTIKTMFVDHNGTLCCIINGGLIPTMQAPAIYSGDGSNIVYYEDDSIKLQNASENQTLFQIDRSDLLRIVHQTTCQCVILVFPNEIRVYTHNILRHSVPVVVDHTIEINILLVLDQYIVFGYIHAGKWNILYGNMLLRQYELPYYTNYVFMKRRNHPHNESYYSLQLMCNNTLIIIDVSCITNDVSRTQRQLNLVHAYDDTEVYYDSIFNNYICRSIGTSFSRAIYEWSNSIIHIDINNQYALIKRPKYSSMYSRNACVIIRCNPESIHLTNFTGVITSHTPVKSSRKI